MVPSQSFTQVVIVKLQSVKTPSSYLAIRGGNVHGKVGVYCDNSNFILAIVSIHKMYHSFNSGHNEGHYYNVNDSTVVQVYYWVFVDVQGRGGPFCDFKVGVLPDNYVILESVSQPGNYINMTARGVPSLSNAVLPTSQDAQFFVRLTKQFYAPRAPLTTPTGMPSLFSKLRSDMIIQLEAFHTGVFLSAMPNAIVSASSNPMDPNSKLLVS